MPDGREARFEDGHDLRLRRIYRQWQLGRRIREPGVVRRGPQGEAEVDVLVELVEGARVPPLLRLHSRGRERPRGVVSGSVNIADIRHLAADRRVRRIESARRISRTLHVSVPSIGADTASLATAFPTVPPYDGTGVIIGIVDDSCDVAHPNFLRGGKTRLLSLWRQANSATPNPPVGYTYGNEYTRANINAALAAGAPYGPMMGNVSPGKRSHGTNVLDIAAGNGSAMGAHPGVAPNADIIFVEVSTADVGRASFIGNSGRLWQAVEYVFKRATQLGRPAVVNISLGTNGGPHDGSALVDEQLELLLSQPGRAIVIAAGNTFGDGCHARRSLNPGRSETLTWVVEPSDDTSNELEVWYTGGPLAVFLTPPGGSEFGPVTLAQGADEFQLPDGTFFFVHHRKTLSGVGHINAFIEWPPLPGAWGVRLQNVGAAKSELDAWIERDGGKETQSHFASGDADSGRTLGSLSCGLSTIVVASHAAKPTPADSVFTSAGATRDGRQKPDLSAPGEDSPGVGIRAAQGTTQGLARIRGTSQAAPHVTGVIALMMQASPTPLTAAAIRSALITSAQSTTGAWDARSGFGRLDAVAAVSKVLP